MKDGKITEDRAIDDALRGEMEAADERFRLPPASNPAVARARSG